MKSEKDNVSQSGAEQEGKVEDLPVDENQQNQVKGGAESMGTMQKAWKDASSTPEGR